MPRPKSNRIVHEPPMFTEFKPIGIKSQELDQIKLNLDEFEAFRLADHVGLSHAEAAEEMEISRSTFTRLIDEARKKISDFIIKGRMLSIDGGNIHFRNNIIHCQNCGYIFKTNIEKKISECPQCGSKNLVNRAGGFGHGACCNQRNRNQKKGGNHARW